MSLGEWLALVQKRDNQVKEAEIISKQKRRAKLELQLVDIKRNCRALTIKNDYEKSEEDRNHEMTLVKQCIDLVQEKDELENEIGDLEEEIQDQRERHAQQMTQNLLEQEKLRQGKLRVGCNQYNPILMILDILCHRLKSYV